MRFRAGIYSKKYMRFHILTTLEAQSVWHKEHLRHNVLQPRTKYYSYHAEILNMDDHEAYISISTAWETNSRHHPFFCAKELIIYHLITPLSTIGDVFWGYGASMKVLQYQTNAPSSLLRRNRSFKQQHLWTSSTPHKTSPPLQFSHRC